MGQLEQEGSQVATPCTHESCMGFPLEWKRALSPPAWRLVAAGHASTETHGYFVPGDLIPP